jgi:hypothetical protein
VLLSRGEVRVHRGRHQGGGSDQATQGGAEDEAQEDRLAPLAAANGWPTVLSVGLAMLAHVVIRH